jgi:NAD(P)-dependent dehydrogenase (short-subunit alcohol dehydrogenase family)
VVHGRPSQQQDAEKIASEIGNNAAVQMASLEDPAECARLVEGVVARFGRIDILVNNAAICSRARLPQTDADLFDQVIAVDVRAPMLLIRAALPHFRNQGGGRVLNIGSVNAYCGEAALVAYAIAKGGLMTMTRNLADAHGAEGIRINQLNPGWVLTPAEYAIKVREGLSKDWPNQVPREHAPGGRIFQPAEIAHFAVAFLGEPAALVNGSVIDIEQFPMIGRLPVKESGF